jgi:hypothetical protein
LVPDNPRAIGSHGGISGPFSLGWATWRRISQVRLPFPFPAGPLQGPEAIGASRKYPFPCDFGGIFGVKHHPGLNKLLVICTDQSSGQRKQLTSDALNVFTDVSAPRRFPAEVHSHQNWHGSRPWRVGRAEKLFEKRRTQIAKKAAAKRWGKN